MHRFLLLALLALSAPAYAAAGIASHGEPALQDGFDHLPYANPDVPKGGQLRIALTGGFDSLNPYIVKGSYPPEMYYGNFIYETLLYRSSDEPFTMYAGLAEPLDIPPDRSAITFRLNDKARWADGQPVTADDIIFSWQTLKKSGRPALRTYYGQVDSATKLDERSVRFIFKPRADKSYDRELPLLIGLMAVLPMHALQGKDFTQTTLTPLMGSGPYQVTEVQPNRRIVLTRRADWWGRDLPVMRGQMNVDRIVLDFYRDETVARQAVMAGADDFKTEADLLRWQQAYRGNALDNHRIDLQAIPHHRPAPYKGFVLNTRRAPFSDPAFRHALAHAASFAQIDRTLYGGQYRRSLSTFAGSALAAVGDEDLQHETPEMYRAQLKQAQADLQQAGYHFADQQLLDKTGKPVTFEILLNDSYDERIALAWAKQLQGIGIAATVRLADSAQFQQRLSDFDYDVVVNRMVNSLSPGNEQRIYWGSANADVHGSRNYAGVHDPNIDAAIDALLAANTYDDLITTTKKLDADLIAGDYVIPFFFTGNDLIARSASLHLPDTVPLMGYDIRTVWSDNR